MSKREQELEIVEQSNKSSLPIQMTNSVVVHTQPGEQTDKLPRTHKKQKKTKKNKIIFFVSIIFLILSVYLILANFKQDPISTPVSFSKTYQQGILEFNQTLSKKFAWIKQRVDHFNPSDQRTFYQRVLINSEGSNLRKDAPVFLFIPNFEPNTQIQKSFLITQQVELNKAISMSIQFRYFGESLPFADESFSLENLQYLTIQQIVEDIAFAIQRIVDNRFFGITSKNLWIVNGARISGSIVAWLRSKYPNLTSGAIASSPIHPTTLVPLVNEKIYSKVESGGKKCRIAIAKIKQNIEEELSDDRRQATLYNIARGVQLTPEEVLYLYSKRINEVQKEFYIFNCQGNEESQLIQAFRAILLTPQFYYYDPIVYSHAQMASEQEWKYFQVVRTARASWYLKCTQLGLFQVSPEKKSFSSQSLNETFFRQRCRSIFNANLWPKPNELVSFYETYMQSASNLLIVHGFYDAFFPYALKGKSKLTQTEVKKCLRCQSTFDYTQSVIKYRQVEQVLEIEKSLISKWLKNGKK